MLNQPIQNSDVIHDTILYYILLSFILQIDVPSPSFSWFFKVVQPPMNETRSCSVCLFQTLFDDYIYHSESWYAYVESNSTNCLFI